MQKLIIIRGIPGSGKTTYSNKMKAHLVKFGYDPNDVVQYEADMYFMDDKGNYNWDADKLCSAHKWCYNKAKEALQNHKIVIVSNTFINRKLLKPYIKLAEETNAECEIYHCTGNWKNVHNVPDETIKRMIEHFQSYDGEILV